MVYLQTFVIRKLIERGIVKQMRRTKEEPVVWDILENVIKGHPFTESCTLAH
jgi:hypothetical protein